METQTAIPVIIISILFSAFFSGVEIAYISVNKLKLELLRNQGSLAGRILSGFVHNSARFLGMTLLGNNIALIVLGSVSSALMEPWLKEVLMSNFGVGYDYQFAIMLIQTIITTAVVLIFGEFLPKALFRANSDGILMFFALPLRLIDYLLYPFSWLIMKISDLILNKMLGMDVQAEKPVYSRVDLEEFVEQFVKGEERDEEEIDTLIFEKAMSLTDVKVRECMVPRTEIVAVEIDDSIEELKKVILDSRHSKIIIYEDTIDNIQGYVHHFDLLKKPQAIADILFPIKVVPETMGARNLMNHFIKEHRSVVWVVDEFGGTAGIVTLEDVLEEVFGEIQDEYDQEEFIERQISGSDYIFSGRLEVDYLNEKYGLELEEGDYETLAGFIVSHHESIPDMDDVIQIGRFEFKIINVSDTRIETVKLKVLGEAE